MPFCTIRILKEAIAADPAAKKAAIARSLSDAIRAATGLAASDVWIVFEEVEMRNWFVGPARVETVPVAGQR